MIGLDFRDSMIEHVLRSREDSEVEAWLVLSWSRLVLGASDADIM